MTTMRQATALTALADRIELWPIDRLRPYERNPRTHSEAQVDQIAASMVEFGWTNPVLVNEQGGVLAGHGRLLAAHKLGLAEVPVIRFEHLSEAQKRAYLIADNQLALQAGWSEELLAQELAWLRDERFDLDLVGFDATELERLLAIADGETASEEAEDNVPDPPEELVSRPGDLWVLGNHRLLCGDATVLTDVERVLGGQLAAAICSTVAPSGRLSSSIISACLVPARGVGLSADAALALVLRVAGAVLAAFALPLAALVFARFCAPSASLAGAGASSSTPIAAMPSLVITTRSGPPSPPSTRIRPRLRRLSITLLRAPPLSVRPSGSGRTEWSARWVAALRMLERHVRDHLGELAEVRPRLR